MKKLAVCILVITLLIGIMMPASGLVKRNEIKTDNSENTLSVLLDQLDQQQTINTGSERIDVYSAGLAQSFEPSKPILTRISVLWTKASGDPEFVNYYLEIRSNIHSSSYLRQIQLDKYDFVDGIKWYTWNFADLFVVPGDSYWIVAYGDIPAITSTQIKWCYGSPGDPYEDGYSMVNTFMGWQAYDLWGDFCFKTYGEDFPNNPPDVPSTPNGPSSGVTGVSYSYSTFSNDDEGDDIKYGWDWDDSSPIEWSGYYNSGNTCTRSHIWTSAGTYDVKVKAKDDQGGESGWSSILTVTISIPNNPPDEPDKPSGPTSGRSGISYTYTSSATDPDGDKVYLLFDWADGTNSGWLGPYNSGDIVSASNIWTAQGSYSVKVQAKDMHGDVSVFSDPLPVNMPRNKIKSLPIMERLMDLFPNLYKILAVLLEQ